MAMFPKGKTRASQKRREQLHEREVIAAVRQKVAARDGWCRLYRRGFERRVIEELFGPCNGASEWAHLNEHRRSATRGLPPEERHTTGGSAMLCTRHHQMEERHTLRFRYLTPRGADGPLQCITEGGIWTEFE